MLKKLTSVQIKEQLVAAGYGYVVEVKKTKYPNTIKIFQQKRDEANVFGCIISGDDGEIFGIRGAKLKASPVEVMDAVKAAGLDFSGVLRISA